jgi:nitroreductase
MERDVSMTVQTMTLTELIRSRRSVATFKDQPVPLDVIHDLLETAVYAPNHRLTEPWRFIYLTGKGRLPYVTRRAEMVLENMAKQTHNEAEQQKAYEGTIQKFSSVPAYLVVAMTKHPNAEVYEEDYAACACVIQNFLLLAWEQGIGTTWKTFKEDAGLRALLGLAEPEKVIGIIHVGYPAEEPRTGQRQVAHERLTVFTGDEL